jgi:hypothetical protein
MASFPIGTTPFLLEIDSARGSSMQEIPHTPDDAAAQEAGQYLLIRLIRGADASSKQVASAPQSTEWQIPNPVLSSA